MSTADAATEHQQIGEYGLLCAIFKHIAAIEDAEHVRLDDVLTACRLRLREDGLHINWEQRQAMLFKRGLVRTVSYMTGCDTVLVEECARAMLAPTRARLILDELQTFCRHNRIRVR